MVSDYGSSRSGRPSADYLLRKAQTADGVATSVGSVPTNPEPVSSLGETSLSLCLSQRTLVRLKAADLPIREGDFKLADDVVVTSVHSLLPRIDKYGLPSYANECEAAKFFREGYGLAAVDDLEVSFKDTGEDGGSRIWFEARVHPDTAAKLKRFLAGQ